MSFLERIFHAILFESLIIIFSLLGLKFVTDHNTAELTVLLILISLIAVVWNFIFNWVFDSYFTGKRTKRSVLLRSFHSIAFELGLLCATLPLIMYWLDMDFLNALLLDVGMTIFILIYTFVFNLCYDNIRLLWAKE